MVPLPLKYLSKLIDARCIDELIFLYGAHKYGIEYVNNKKKYYLFVLKKLSQLVKTRSFDCVKDVNCYFYTLVYVIRLRDKPEKFYIGILDDKYLFTLIEIENCTYYYDLIVRIMFTKVRLTKNEAITLAKPYTKFIEVRTESKTYWIGTPLVVYYLKK